MRALVRRLIGRLNDQHNAERDPDSLGADEEEAAQERLIAEALGYLRDMDVREVMTPRVDVVALVNPVDVDVVAKAVRSSGHSCFPVVNGDLDDLVGVLYVNDLFRSRRGQGASALFAGLAGGETGGISPADIARRLRQPLVLPESRRILSALVEMRRQRRSFAIVVDEYGGVAGVITVKDLLEPLVGELHDELDDPEESPDIVRVDPSRWLVAGQTSVDEIHEVLGLSLPNGDYLTVAGFLLDGFGHIPEEGETLTVDGWELSVAEMVRRRIDRVVVKQPAGPLDGTLGEEHSRR